MQVRCQNAWLFSCGVPKFGGLRIRLLVIMSFAWKDADVTMTSLHMFESCEFGSPVAVCGSGDGSDSMAG